jgi:hypothetical protein
MELEYQPNVYTVTNSVKNDHLYNKINYDCCSSKSKFSDTSCSVVPNYIFEVFEIIYAHPVQLSIPTALEAQFMALTTIM